MSTRTPGRCGCCNGDRQVCGCYRTDTGLAAENMMLRDALKRMLKVYAMLMPGVKHIAVQDYKELNEAPIAARAALERGGRP